MRFDAVKFVNHADDHSEDPLLRVRPLSTGELKTFYRGLATSLGQGPEVAAGTMLRRLAESAVPVTGVNADVPSFNPMQALGAALVPPSGEVFFTLGEIDDVWRISIADAVKYFDSIWYPGPDDLLLVDPEARWAVRISENGRVSTWVGNSAVSKATG